MTMDGVLFSHGMGHAADGQQVQSIYSWERKCSRKDGCNMDYSHPFQHVAASNNDSTDKSTSPSNNQENYPPHSPKISGSEKLLKSRKDHILEYINNSTSFTTSNRREITQLNNFQFQENTFNSGEDISSSNIDIGQQDSCSIARSVGRVDFQYPEKYILHEENNSSPTTTAQPVVSTEIADSFYVSQHECSVTEEKSNGMQSSGFQQSEVSSLVLESPLKEQEAHLSTNLKCALLVDKLPSSTGFEASENVAAINLSKDVRDFTESQSPKQIDHQELEVPGAALNVPKKLKEKVTPPNRMRPCPFCLVPQSKLSRHITLKHKSEQTVIIALRANRKDRIKCFEKFRKVGIEKANEESLKNGTGIKYVEKLRGCQTNYSKCSYCFGYFMRTSFKRHKFHCEKKNSQENIHSIPVIPVHAEEKYMSEIICQFRKDEVGLHIRGNNLIIGYGRRKYNKTQHRKAKKTGLRTALMINMRRLGNVCNIFKQKILESGLPYEDKDIFKPDYMTNLISSIEDVSGDKASVKLSYGYLFKTFCKFWQIEFASATEHSNAKNCSELQALLKANWEHFFGEAEYYVNHERSKALRKPCQLPCEKDLADVRTYLLEKLKNVDDLVWDKHTFVEFRRILVCRLTFLNARRGGEPTRLTQKEYDEAKNDVWVDKAHQKKIKDQEERRLFDVFKTAYQSGKGNSTVPILIPVDCIPAMDKLADMNLRKSIGLPETNIFLFASSRSTEHHSNGWNDVHSICKMLNTKTNLTATKMRHRASTYVASLDISEQNREAFYRHMGHSKEINQNRYQCPLTFQEVAVVGKHVEAMDASFDS